MVCRKRCERIGIADDLQREGIRYEPTVASHFGSLAPAVDNLILHLLIFIEFLFLTSLLFYYTNEIQSVPLKRRIWAFLAFISSQSPLPIIRKLCHEVLL